jgi:exopolyphosphatase/guanosine-5'-triphosphate,3'-diphosphate pyrophosphatase
MTCLASIDIGSNTVKLLVATVGPEGTLEPLSREKDLVRLGHETFATGRLSPEAIEAGSAAVERLAKIARAAGAEAIRAVATCAVREAENASEFIAAVRARCGVEVEVISGEEEARLITLAVRSEFPESCDPLFLVDIGGGSTELVVSDGDRVLFAESVELGVVRLAEKYLRHDPASREDRADLVRNIRRRVAAAARRVARTGFKTCVGTSGTVQSMSMIYEAAVRGKDIFSSGHRTLPRKGLKKVNALLRKTTLKEKLRLPGLDPKRRDIAVPGGILLAEIMKRSGAEEILTGERGLREGILLDHLSRRRQGTLAPIARDVRESSVERMARRTNVELMHARHVAALADQIFESTHSVHQMTGREREWLCVAAILHDAGSSIGYTRHHKHTHYLIRHGELPGFSAEEVATIAAVARYHRGARPRAKHAEWRELDPWRRQSVEKLAAILRIADGLDRGHRQAVASVACRIRQKRVVFEVGARADLPGGTDEIAPELESASRKAKLFFRVFGRRAVFHAEEIVSRRLGESKGTAA